MRETTLQTPRSVKKEGEEVLQAPEKRFPCSPWRSTVEQISTCSLWRTPHQSRWMHPKVAVTPWREEATLEQVRWQDL